MFGKKSTSIAAGAVIMVLMRWVDRLIGIVSTLVLARLLVPDDFGIVAMASLVVGFVDIIFDLGVNIAVIQRKNPAQSYYNTAWTLRIIQAGCVALALVALAPFAADYYNDERVTAAIRVMAASVLVVAFENIGIVNFQKELDFAADARFTLAKRLAIFFISIALTLVLDNYWGMILGVLVGRLFSTAWSYVVHPMRPRFSLLDFKEIFSISQWVLVKNISQYLDRNLHIIIVGGRSTTGVTGGYTLANEIADVPGTDLLAPINRVLFPAFAQVKDDRNELTKMLIKAQSIQVLITFPTCIGFAMTCAQFVPLALGDKWMFIVPFIQILALSNIVQSICSSSNYVLTVIGQIRVLAITSWAQILIFCVGLLVFRADLSPVMVAAIRFGAICLTFGLSYYILVRYVPTVSILAMLKGIVRPALGCAAMVGCLSWLSSAMALPTAWLLMLKVVVGAVAYCSVVMALWLLSGKPDGAEQYILDKLGRKGRTMKAA